MQLLCTFETGGFDAWKAQYDDAAEGRQLAGLTQLQIWQEADSPGTALVLFQVNDRARAAEWLTRLRSAGLTSAHFLRTI